jgi:hypothetical protein
MPISRSQMNRQLRMGGGIMQVAPRQGALFGGLKKAVSGALGSAKDLLKSPLGKAALLYGGSKLLPMAFGQLGKAGGISELFSKGLSTLGLDVASGAKPTLGQFGKVFAIGSLGGAALQALTASGADEEELGNIRDVESLKSYLRQGYKQLNPQAEPEQVEAFVETNTTEYRADGGRIGFAEGMPEEGIETLLPKPKPSEMMQGVDKTIQSIDNFAQLIAQSGSPSDMRGHMDLFSDFIQKNNVDAGPAFQYLKNRVKELKPGMERYIYISNEDMPVQKAVGGRINYEGGGSTDFEKWLEGKQKFDQGQNAEQLYREYLEDKRRQKVAEQKTMAANGGRIGFFKGAQADARAGRGAMSPGTSMSGGFRGGGDGGGDGGGNKDTTPKTNIFEKIKNNPIYQTVSPFVNPFSIGMSQIPIKAQQAIGIGSLLNKLGNVIFSPAGAAEFDMEAFQKAGADKGFFGGMNDELEAMQEYYDAAKSLTASGAKFAGANNPQAVRDFITKQSEIPFGGGSYNIDMSLVPKTFLETQQDFTTQKAPISFFNLGGRAGYAFGDVVDQASGIMGLPQRINQAGVKELDLRDSGGFIPPVGVKEKADDIPAMLSNNEFVFTADAVRGMGDGNVNKGAQRMYDMMKKLEGGGRV